MPVEFAATIAAIYIGAFAFVIIAACALSAFTGWGRK